ncbi:hypothetical protein OG949_12840 [Streptomyces scopuliridis]|uniref:DUF6542 domain-containing protein n=1 Tax=Streptomyces scopuliridis TaxID=452529 RepID=UPI000996D592|nr:DUF6542 domain-containing protein [Streptomyces scopuliridis]WSB33667.1 hypothetical protein OG949_12840 [Streptomyces scopuliridis]
MEQHRTRQPQQRRQRPPGPRTATGTGATGVYRVPVTPRPRVSPLAQRLRRLPNPRFTGLGAGLFAAATMLAIAFLDRLLLDGAPLVYGVLFLLVSAVTALWVRTADLVTAPISVPIAFAAGAYPIAGGTGGFGGQTMALVTTLAVHAGWLYGGTLIAGLIASVRKVRQMGRRQTARDAAARAAATRAGATAYRAAGPRPGTRAPRPTVPRAVRRG